MTRKDEVSYGNQATKFVEKITLDTGANSGSYIGTALVIPLQEQYEYHVDIEHA